MGVQMKTTKYITLLFSDRDAEKVGFAFFGEKCES